MWRAIHSVLPVIWQHSIWTVLDGESINMWDDHWIPRLGPIKSNMEKSIHVDMMGLKVACMVKSDGEWDTDFLDKWQPRPSGRKLC